jgi:hypothetical protein
MEELLRVDLLSPPGFGDATLASASASETLELPVTNMDDLGLPTFELNGGGGGSSSSSAAPMTHSFVPKIDDIGPATSSDGFVNPNAQTFLPSHSSYNNPAPVILSNSDLAKAKRGYLNWFKRQERRGNGPSRRFTMDDSVDDMKAEKEAMMQESNREFAIKIMEWTTIAIASGAEKTAESFPKLGLKLDSYSQNIQDSMDELDMVFDEMYDDLSDSIKFSPGMKYMLIMARGAAATHAMNKMQSAYGPDVADVMRSDPELAKRITQALAEKTAANARNVQPQAHPQAPAPTAAQNQRASDPLAALAQFGSFGMGGGPPAPVQTKPQQQARPPTPPLRARNVPSSVSASASRKELTGPANMDEILRKIDLAPPSVGGAPKPPSSKKSTRSVVTLNL